MRANKFFNSHLHVQNWKTTIPTLYVSPGFLAGSCQLWAPGRSYTKTLAGFLALTKGALQGTWLTGMELSDVLFIAVEDGSD